MRDSQAEPAPRFLKSPNLILKIGAKRLLRNDDLVFLLKAAKIAFDASVLGHIKIYDNIFKLLPSIIHRSDPVVLDVGANMGQFSSRMSRQFPGGQIYCFEPVHINAKGLRRVQRWLRLKNVSVFEEALCDVVGVESIHIPTIGGAFRDAAFAVLEGSMQAYNNITYQVEVVQTNTIDAFVAEHKATRVDFIKVDTEGAEDRVVQGATETIDRFLPALYLEAPFDEPWLSPLYGKGYQPFYNDGVTFHMPRTGERQMNVLLVHCSKLSPNAGPLSTVR